jgi:hypothetical protein
MLVKPRLLKKVSNVKWLSSEEKANSVSANGNMKHVLNIKMTCMISMRCPNTEKLEDVETIMSDLPTTQLYSSYG